MGEYRKALAMLWGGLAWAVCTRLVSGSIWILPLLGLLMAVNGAGRLATVSNWYRWARLFMALGVLAELLRVATLLSRAAAVPIALWLTACAAVCALIGSRTGKL